MTLSLLDDLRFLLYEPPSAHTWDKICRAISDAFAKDPVFVEAVGLPYAIEHLKGWPTALRRVPDPWLDALLKGEPWPPLQLARAVRLGRHLKSRRELDLGCGGVANTIEHLDLRGLVLTRDAIEGLGKASVWGGLKTLLADGALEGNDLAGLLAVQPALAALEHLSLARCRLGAGALEMLGNSGLVGGLRHLDVSLNRVGSGEPWSRLSWSSLETLVAGGNNLGDAGFRTLVQSMGLPALTHLRISHNGLSGRSIEALVGQPWFGRLKMLGLDFNPLRVGGLRPLTAWRGPSSLEGLSLKSTALGNKGAEAVAGASWLSGLNTLWLDSNGIAYRGAEALALAPWGDGMATLGLTHNHLGQAGLRALRASVTLPKVARDSL